MRIRNFCVSGYKNLTRPIRLQDLDPVTVFYGANNVGKSNLLEAIALPFALLGLGQGDASPIPLGTPERLSKGHMRDAGYDLEDIFTFDRPTPIRLDVELDIDEAQLTQEAIRPVFGVSPIKLSFVIDPEPPHPTWYIARFQFSDGTDAASHDGNEAARLAARKFSLYLARNYLVNKPRLQQLDSTRYLRRDGYPDRMQGVLLELYDAQESMRRFQHWELFQKSLAHFKDVLGTDTIRAVYNRHTHKADVVLQRGNARIPTRLLGTGVQQLVYLLGELCTSGASVLLIEEPEANLAFGLQMRLRKVLHNIATDPVNPSQLIFTSHSPGFQIERHFFFMEDTDDGPRIRRGASDQLALATGFVQAAQELPQHSAPYSWVTQDGLVRLPEDVRAQIGVPEGGGVAFLQDAERPGYRIMSNAQALEEIGWNDEDG